MAETDRLTVVTQAVKDKVLAASLTPAVPAGSVFWPDQVRIPRTPAIGIDSGTMTKVVEGSGGKGYAKNNFTVFLMCYLCKVQDIQLTEKSVEQFAESVMDALHAPDMKMGGTVVYGHVTMIEPGYSTRNGLLFRTARITWEGYSKLLIT